MTFSSTHAAFLTTILTLAAFVITAVTTDAARTTEWTLAIAPASDTLAATTTDAEDEDERRLVEQEERIRKALENAEFRKLHDILGGSLPKVEPRPTVMAKTPPNAPHSPLLAPPLMPPHADVRVMQRAGDWVAFLRSEVSRLDKMIWNRLYNIENVATVGFKEVVYEFAAPLPTFHRASERVSQRIVGGGAGDDVEIPVRLVMRQGALVRTSRGLDLALSGHAFFAVTDSKTGEHVFTRGGRFEIGDDGSLGVSTSRLDNDGWGMSLESLEPPMQVPPHHRRLVVSLRGNVWSLDADSNEHAIGSLPLVTFRDATRLVPRGGGLYAASAASGPPEPLAFNVADIASRDADHVEVRQGFLEQSNVESDRERQTLEQLHQLRSEYLRLLPRP